MDTGIPKTVKKACYLWIIYGLVLMLSLIIFFYTFIFHIDSDFFSRNCFIILIILPILFLGSISFIYTGFKIIQGKLKDVLGSAIASILFGILPLVFLLLDNQTFSYEPILYIVNVGLLLVAGILALVGRKEYKQWHADKQ